MDQFSKIKNPDLINQAMAKKIDYFSAAYKWKKL